MENKTQEVAGNTSAGGRKPAPDIGSILKEARKKKSASLEEANQHTRIPRKFLEALEENRFDIFPAKAYFRGFLKNYCDYLDTDFDPLWKLVEADTTPAPPPSAPPTPAAAKPEPSSHAHPLEESSSWPEFDAQSIGAFVVAAALAIFAVSWGLYSRQRKIQADAPVSVPNVLKPLGVASGYAISVVLDEEAWIKLVCDGAVQFEGQAPRHSQENCKAYQSVLLRTNDSSAVTVSVNGSTQTLPAQDGSGNYRIPLP